MIRTVPNCYLSDLLKRWSIWIRLKTHGKHFFSFFKQFMQKILQYTYETVSRSHLSVCAGASSGYVSLYMLAPIPPRLVDPTVWATGREGPSTWPQESAWSTHSSQAGRLAMMQLVFKGAGKSECRLCRRFPWKVILGIIWKKGLFFW